MEKVGASWWMGWMVNDGKHIWRWGYQWEYHAEYSKIVWSMGSMISVGPPPMTGVIGVPNLEVGISFVIFAACNWQYAGSADGVDGMPW